jgi:hypothetical protein
LMALMAGMLLSSSLWMISYTTDVSDESPTIVKNRSDFSNEEKMNIHMCLMGGGQWCDVILDPVNSDTYSDAIQEQCEMMPGMSVCHEYFSAL